MEDPAPDEEAQLALEVEHLRRAVASRDVIGQAKGILMERQHLSADEAFEELVTLSKATNVKVVEIAERLTRTGEWPPAP